VRWVEHKFCRADTGSRCGGFGLGTLLGPEETPGCGCGSRAATGSGRPNASRCGGGGRRGVLVCGCVLSVA
jgi:hypothetical protein